MTQLISAPWLHTCEQLPLHLPCHAPLQCIPNSAIYPKQTSHPGTPDWLQSGQYFKGPASRGEAALPGQPPITPAPSTCKDLLPTSLVGGCLLLFLFFTKTSCKMDVRRAPTFPCPHQRLAAPASACTSHHVRTKKQRPSRTRCRQPRAGWKSHTDTTRCPRDCQGRRSAAALWTGLRAGKQVPATVSLGGPISVAAHTRAAATRSAEQATHMHTCAQALRGGAQQQDSQERASRAPGPGCRMKTRLLPEPTSRQASGTHRPSQGAHFLPHPRIGCIPRWAGSPGACFSKTCHPSVLLPPRLSSELRRPHPCPGQRHQRAQVWSIHAAGRLRPDTTAACKPPGDAHYSPGFLLLPPRQILYALRSGGRERRHPPSANARTLPSAPRGP